MSATLASFLVVYVLCVRTGSSAAPAILAATLAVGLTRAPEPLAIGALLRRILLLPLVAIGAALVGATLLQAPPTGAAVFTIGMTASVALRQFGKSAAAVARTIAVTLIAMLVVPVPLDRSAGASIAWLVLAAGAIAQLCAWAGTLAGRHLGLIAPGEIQPNAPNRAVAHEAAAAPEAKAPSISSATSRMAAQMLAALALAFAIGMPAFRQHWPWVVLSAFIVCSGAVGRGDALYKALLRVGGAVGGTFAAMLVARIHFGNSVEYAAVVFAVLFAGIWLRRISYAYWAACATLIFALLQGAGTQPAIALFGTRVLCIVIGAACGVAAAWFVFPIRTRQVVRRRIANALAAMRDVLRGAQIDLARHVTELDRIAPPLRLHRRLVRASARAAHSATQVERTRALLERIHAGSYDRTQAAGELRRLRGDVFPD